MKAPKIFRYLWRDKVDLIMLLLTIMFGVLSIKSLSGESKYVYWLLVLNLYIIGVMVRMGMMTDLLKYYIKDPEIRRTLGLDHKESKGDKIAGVIFFGVFLILYVFIFITLYSKI